MAGALVRFLRLTFTRHPIIRKVIVAGFQTTKGVQVMSDIIRAEVIEYLPRIDAAIIEPPPVVTVPPSTGPRNRTHMNAIVKMLTTWAKTEPFAEETRTALLKALRDLESLHTTQWTYVDESQFRLRCTLRSLKNGGVENAIAHVEAADRMLSKWQARGGMVGNCVPELTD